MKAVDDQGSSEGILKRKMGVLCISDPSIWGHVAVPTYILDSMFAQKRRNLYSFHFV